MLPRSNSNSHSNSHKYPEPEPEVVIPVIPVNDNTTEQKPTPSSNKKTLTQMYQDFLVKYPNWDVYMVFELFVFMLSFFFLVGDEGRGVDGFYLYQVNSVLLVDFLFRLLSIEIESIRREYWNHVLHCILPLVMWLLAAYYKFEEVFGSDPIKVLNALLFSVLNLFVICVIVLKFVTFEQIKEKFKKKEENVENNEKEENV